MGMKSKSMSRVRVRGDARALMAWDCAPQAASRVERVWGRRLFDGSSRRPAWGDVVKWVVRALPLDGLCRVLTSWCSFLVTQYGDLTHDVVASAFELFRAGIGQEAEEAVLRATLVRHDIECVAELECRGLGLTPGAIAEARDLPPLARAWGGLRSLVITAQRAASGDLDGAAESLDGAARWVAWTLGEEERVVTILTWLAVHEVESYVLRMVMPTEELGQA